MPDDPKNWPLSGVNLSATIIYCLTSGLQIASATGFFFRHSSVKYLVTNRHVVVDETEGYYPDTLQIKLHASASNPKENINIDIALYDSRPSRLWKEHCQYKKTGCDIVLVPLPEPAIAPACINFFTAANFLPSDINLSAFSDVVIVGYPLGFHDEVNNLPIYRSGMIASSFPFGFKDKPCFLIDAKLHSGTSGSMVLNSDHNILRNSKTGAGFHTDRALLLGVFSDEYVVKGDPLGLNTVWHAQLLQEIAENPS